MDFPLYYLDLMGNRLLIAMIATLHVWINHALAVGFIPLVVLLEYIAFRIRKVEPEQSTALDGLAKRMMAVGFILTTSIGALTGVGIWFAAALVNPAAIGSLIRVFYGAWFTEWLVFVLEVIFIMAFYLLWKGSAASEAAKRRHIAFGGALTIFSWLTMGIIVAILGFQMDPGSWLSRQTFLHGFLNPIYIPQLYFRTPMAMMMGGAFALFLVPFLSRRGEPVRRTAIRYTSLWLLIWSPVGFAGAILYRASIPTAMLANFPVAVGTLAFQQWYGSLLDVILGAVAVAVLVGLWGFLWPRWLPRAAAMVPIVALFLFMGSFERVREFMRKPYVIGGYMYANGLRVADYPLYRRDGLLAHAAYAGIRSVTPANRVQAGEEVFLLACSRCHTVGGLNSVVTKFRNLAGPGRTLDEAFVRNYVPGMHKAWYFMPPFPGNDAELDALAAFIVHAHRTPVRPRSDQDDGLPAGAPAWAETPATGGIQP
jgi:mono/diheme cytochrome c family protein